MTYFVTALRENPELAIFLTLAVGFVIGRLRFGSFSLGNVVGTLLAGVVIGQLEIKVDPIVKVVFFDLFLFATGYKVGPQFFRGLKKNAGSQVALTLVLCITSLVVTVTAAKIFGYDSGTAAGLMAGAFTESTVIGTAGQTIEHLNIPAADKLRMLNNIPVAYAVSYLVGTGFVVWFLSSLAPRLLKVDLKAESRKLEAALATGAARPVPGSSAYREWDLRAFRIGDAGPAANRTVWEFEQSLAPERVFVERVRKGGLVAEPEPGTRLAPGDAVVIGARRHVMLAIATTIGPEIEDRALLDFPLAAVDVVLTDKDLAERTLAEVAALQGRGVVLSKLIRGGEEIPFAADTVLNRGDLLRLSGAKSDVERAGHALGYIERPSSETDVVFVGIGILVGGLFGLLTLTVGSVPLSLTASGGALVMGLVFGWLRSVRPTFGRIPEPALWVFDTIGLAVFIGVVGLSAGPSFVTGLQQMGPSLLLVGFVVAMTPHIAALLFGRYILKMNPVILFGACAGAGTVTAALRSIQDEADSKLPVLGYTVPYAIGNLLLTAWGPVIVMLTQ
jgi:putative transport protein